MDSLDNICIFTNTLLSGGAVKQAVLLVKALSEKYNVWLIVYSRNKVEQKFQTIIDENEIRLSLKNYEWGIIVNKHMKPVLSLC